MSYEDEGNLREIRYSVNLPISYADLLKFYIGVSQLYEELGGSGFTLKEEKTIHLARVPASEYDLFDDAPWDDQIFEYAESIEGSPNFPRKEVFGAVGDVVGGYFPKRLLSSFKIRRGLVEKFPLDIWGDEFPGISSVDFIVSGYLPLLKRIVTDESVELARKKMASGDFDSF